MRHGAVFTLELMLTKFYSLLMKPLLQWAPSENYLFTNPILLRRQLRNGSSLRSIRDRLSSKLIYRMSRKIFGRTCHSNKGYLWIPLFSTIHWLSLWQLKEIIYMFHSWMNSIIKWTQTLRKNLFLLTQSSQMTTHLRRIFNWHLMKILLIINSKPCSMLIELSLCRRLWSDGSQIWSKFMPKPSQISSPLFGLPRLSLTWLSMEWARDLTSNAVFQNNFWLESCKKSIPHKYGSSLKIPSILHLISVVVFSLVLQLMAILWLFSKILWIHLMSKMKRMLNGTCSDHSLSPFTVALSLSSSPLPFSEATTLCKENSRVLISKFESSRYSRVKVEKKKRFLQKNNFTLITLKHS